jgi:snRNA-activating protein complex subunit 3
MLDCVVDFEKIDTMMADKFATIRLLRSRRSLKPKKHRNAISASEKAAVVREAPGSLVPVGSAAPPSVLFHVALYHARDNGLRSEEFLLAGDNTLSELRDRIYCRNAKLGSFPGKDTSFFGIEGVLYTDCPSCSEPPLAPPASAESASTSAAAPASGMESLTALLEEDLSDAPPGSDACCNASATVAWNRHALAMRGNHGWGVLQTESMLSTHIQDLKVRLGAHYVFSHLGQCEHTLVFLDVRFASAEPGYDLLLNRCYPRRIHQMRRMRQLCHMCKTKLASIVAIGDRMASTNPALFCAPCYDLSHRTISGGAVITDNETISYLHD